MKHRLNRLGDEALEDLFDDSFDHRIDQQFPYRARNREARRRHLRTSMKGEPVRYQ